MTEKDKRIYDTLMNIHKGCTYIHLIYGGCDGCPFYHNKMCVMEELAHNMDNEPHYWDMISIKELIEL